MKTPFVHLKQEHMTEIAKNYKIDVELGLIISRKQRKVIGSTKNRSGHVYATLCCDTFRMAVGAHRVIYLFATGHLPDEIDHINGNPADNRIVNLRPISRSDNMRNVSSKNGLPVGICYVKSRGCYKARVRRPDGTVFCKEEKSLVKASKAWVDEVHRLELEDIYARAMLEHNVIH